MCCNGQNLLLPYSVLFVSLLLGFSKAQQSKNSLRETVKIKADRGMFLALVETMFVDARDSVDAK